jgi:K+-transporting ATPase ATPase C chain
MKKSLLTSIRATLFLLIVTGFAYPLVVDGAAHLLFPHRADGSLITKNGVVIGSSLIGQPFSKPGYFHPRPSATPDPTGSGSVPYDAAFSSASNLAPSNGAQIKAVTAAARAYRKENGLSPSEAVPVDAVTASGSGLDPDISLANALLQAARVARARHLPPDRVRSLVMAHLEGPQFGLLGAKHVNVLRLNLALDALNP